MQPQFQQPQDIQQQIFQQQQNDNKFTMQDESKYPSPKKMFIFGAQNPTNIEISEQTNIGFMTRVLIFVRGSVRYTTPGKVSSQIALASTSCTGMYDQYQRQTDIIAVFNEIVDVNQPAGLTMYKLTRDVEYEIQIPVNSPGTIDLNFFWMNTSNDKATKPEDRFHSLVNFNSEQGSYELYVVI